MPRGEQESFSWMFHASSNAVNSSRIHNVSVANHGIVDPPLTPFGEEQCRTLAETFPHHSSVDLLVCSPLRRTINTTLLGFGSEIASGAVPAVIALPELQETSAYPCDTGSDASTLRQEMQEKPLDLSRVEDGWNSKTGRWAPEPEAFRKRTRSARLWLRARAEKDIVVVTHGAILHYLTEDWSDYDPEAGTSVSIRSLNGLARRARSMTNADFRALHTATGWKNVEFRTYRFESETDENASLVETATSRKRRDHTGKILEPTETARLGIHAGDPKTESIRSIQAKV